MKKILLFVLFLMIGVSSNAQVRYIFNNRTNSLSITAIVLYKLNSSNFYYKEENLNIEDLPVNSIKNYYAYDKKNKKLYVETAEGNYVIVLMDDYAKYYKKADNIPSLKDDDIKAEILTVNQKLADYYNLENAKKQKAIDERKAKEKEDSLRKAKEDSLLKAQQKQKMEIYRKTHKFSHVPVANGSLHCTFCDTKIEISDTIICYAANRDSIVWLDKLEGELALYYNHVHKAAISRILKDYEPYNFHYTVFEDSLKSRYNDISAGELEMFNANRFYEHMQDIKKIAPNGYFLNWGWDSEYSSITFNFTYRNTNKNTIKYIEVFFVVTNDVGDVRKTGSFKGTGPVKEWESASWDWDHSSYYVAGDASNMNISKVIITYMNGTKVTIPKNKIYFN